MVVPPQPGTGAFSTHSGECYRVDKATAYRCFDEINVPHDEAARLERECQRSAETGEGSSDGDDSERYGEARRLYERALDIAHRHIADGLLFPLDELTYRLNLGLCCKRCGDWLAAETHYNEVTRLLSRAPQENPFFARFKDNLQENVESLISAMCGPLSIAAGAPEMAAGMRTGPEASEALRQRGNELFKLGKYYGAIRLYSHALGALVGVDASTNHDNRHLILSNRSASWLNLGDCKPAVADARVAVSVGPDDWPKGHFRLAEALVKLGAYQEAVAEYEKAIALTPGEDLAMKSKEAAARKLLNRQRQNEKNNLADPAFPAGSGASRGGHYFQSWASTAMGRLDRLLAKSLAESGGDVTAAADAIFAPRSKISDHYAAHCDWHDGMKIALMYRSVGAMLFDEGVLRGGRELHIPLPIYGVEGFRLLSNAVLVDRTACMVMGMFIDGEPSEYQSILYALEGMTMLFQRQDIVPGVCFEMLSTDDDIRAALSGKMEPGFSAGKDGDDDPEVVRKVLNKAELTIRMCLVSSYLSTIMAGLSIEPGTPKGFTKKGQMARQYAEYALAWWLGTKDRLLSLIPGGERGGGSSGRWGGFHCAKREAARRGLPQLAALMGQDHIIILRFEGMIEALDPFHATVQGSAPMPKPTSLHCAPDTRSPFASPEDESTAENILVAIINLVDELLDADGSDSQDSTGTNQFFKPGVLLGKRAWALYELGMYADAAEAYMLSYKLAEDDGAHVNNSAEEIFEEGNALGICAGEASKAQKKAKVDEDEDAASGGATGRDSNRHPEASDEDVEEVSESATINLGQLRTLFARGAASEVARLGVWGPVKSRAKAMLKTVLDAFEDKPDDFSITRRTYITTSTGKAVEGSRIKTGIAVDVAGQESEEIEGLLPNLRPMHTVGAAKAQAESVVPRPKHGGLPRDGWSLP